MSTTPKVSAAPNGPKDLSALTGVQADRPRTAAAASRRVNAAHGPQDLSALTGATPATPGTSSSHEAHGAHETPHEPHASARRSAPIALHGAPSPTYDDSTPSAPESTARQGRTKAIGALVYFSSASENTSRFVAGLKLGEAGINVYRIPLKPNGPMLNVREPYVIMVPTYGGGDARKAVPPQVKRFLNRPSNRAWIRGVIASGNTNFGTAYGAAGDIIAAKCRVPYLYRFELMGTREDSRKVRDGLVRFFTQSH